MPDSIRPMVPRWQLTCLGFRLAPLKRAWRSGLQRAALVVADTVKMYQMRYTEHATIKSGCPRSSSDINLLVTEPYRETRS